MDQPFTLSKVSTIICLEHAFLKRILLKALRKMTRHSYFNCILIRSYSKINSEFLIKIMLSEALVQMNYKHLDGVLLSEFMILKVDIKVMLIQVIHLNCHLVAMNNKLEASWEDQMNLQSKKSKCF